MRAVAAQLLAHSRADGAALPELTFGDGGGVHEAGVLLLDSSKAAERLGWQGRLSLDEALRLTWQWHRAHRLGQERPVMVYKLVARGTLEESMLQLQDDKRQLTTAALREGGITHLAPDDLQALFRRLV